MPTSRAKRGSLALTDQALCAEQAGVSATTVWTAPADQRIIAHHSIAPTVLCRKGLPSRSIAGATPPARATCSADSRSIDRPLHEQGLASPLIDALEHIVSACDQGGGRLIVVDATDDAAAAFYEHHDFRPVTGTDRLVMKIASARAALSQ